MTPFDLRLPLIAAQARVKTCHAFHCWSAMREMGTSFHKEAFAQFTGLELHHIDRIIQALADHSALPGPKREASPRGTRLPMDWTLPDDWLNHATEQRKWQPDDVRKEAAAFADFWQAKAGQNAVKLDWRKTWQNWVRNSHRPDGDYAAAPEKTPAELLASYEERYERAKARGYKEGMAVWGPLVESMRARIGSNVVPIRAVT